MQSNFSPRNIAANKVERVVPNALKDFRGGKSVLGSSRSTFNCIDTAKTEAHVLWAIALNRLRHTEDH